MGLRQQSSLHLSCITQLPYLSHKFLHLLFSMLQFPGVLGIGGQKECLEFADVRLFFLCDVKKDLPEVLVCRQCGHLVIEVDSVLLAMIAVRVSPCPVLPFQVFLYWRVSVINKISSLD